MGKWRVAAILVGLLCAAAAGVRGVSSGVLGGIFFPRHDETRRAIGDTLDRLETAGRPIYILSESVAVDRRVSEALPAFRYARATILPRDVAAIEEAARAGQLLALPDGRQYLELLGFEFDSLPPQASGPLSPWARVRHRLHCAEIRADRWSPLPGVDYTGRLGLRLPASPDGAMVLVIGDAVPLEIDAQALDGMPIPIHKEVLRAGPASTAPADFWLGDGNPWSAPGAVVRLTIAAQPRRDGLISLRLGRRAPRVLARLKGYDDAARAHICAAPLGVDDAVGSASAVVVLPDTPEYFGTGWYGPELGPSGPGPVRWMKGQGVILVPSRRRGTMEVRLVGTPAGETTTTLTLTVNDVFTAAPVTLAPGASSYHWTVPRPIWLAGTNELLFSISRTARASERDTRDRGFALERLELRLIPAP